MVGKCTFQRYKVINRSECPSYRAPKCCKMITIITKRSCYKLWHATLRQLLDVVIWPSRYREIHMKCTDVCIVQCALCIVHQAKSRLET